jgi:pimeloyl-ACP methyl ester carboxylesterase
MRTKPVHLDGADLLGGSRLTTEATSGVIDIVEAIHSTILSHILPATQSDLAKCTAGVYAAVRGIGGAVGKGLDLALSQYVSEIGEIRSTPERDAVLAVLNGVVGDHLAATGNPLSIPMRFRRFGRVLEMKKSSLAAAIPGACDRVLLFVHGLCMNDRQWGRNGRNPGAVLARDLRWTPVYLHFNTGLHVSTNGRALADLLERLVEEWPVRLRELAVIGHSCGGLVARSAHYYGTSRGHTWPKFLRHLVFLGTPHHGSALERTGNYVNQLLDSTPYSSPFARIGRIRSSGITDMRYGNVIDADWEGIDRFQNVGDRRQVVPLPKGVRSFAVAAEKNHGSSKAAGGDGLVSVDSALGRHADAARTLSFPLSHQWVAHQMSHFDLLRGSAVYRKIREWLTP